MLAVMTHGFKQVGNVMVVQGVANVTAVAPGAHEAQRTQDPEVVRGSARPQLGGTSELLDRALAFEQLDEQPQSAWGGERLERLAELLGLVGRERARGGSVLCRMGHVSMLRRMSKCSYVLASALVAAGSASLLTPAAVHAHALFGDHDPDRPLIDYLPLGFGHMVGGWDHLLFIAGVVLLSGSWRTAAKLISLFVLGHSITLLVATLAGWQLNATVVDVVIALSLVYVGIQGWRGRPENLRLTGAIVFGFGLVHGLGLSTRLQDLGLPDSGLVERVLLFNVGVELGQLAALTVIVTVGTLIARQMSEPEAVRRAAFGMLAAGGLVAAAILSFPSEQATQQSEPERPAATPIAIADGCAEGSWRQDRLAGGGHPAKRFYEPRETAPERDLAHVIGDGYVIVRYRADLAQRQLERLRTWLTNKPDKYAIVVPDREQSVPVRAVTSEKALTCNRVDVASVANFHDRWLEGLIRQQAG